MGMYEVIKNRCKELGVSISQMERDLGFARGSIGKIDAHKPSYERLEKIADYLGISTYMLVYEGNKQLKDSTIDRMLTLIAAEESGSNGSTPIFNVAAGDGAYNDTYATEFADENLDDGYSLCTVHGDSMKPFLLDGDVVKVKLQTETTPQDFTVIKVDGEHCTVKHVEIVDNGVWLRAENKSVYKDRFYTTQEVITLPINIIGKVVELRRRLE